MYTLDTNSNRIIKTSFVYLLVSLFCALFGLVYEIFSHEVYSFYMIYAFLFPLIGGTLVFFLLHRTKAKRFPNAFSRNLYHSGIATLTVGSIIRGVLDIYGTTNRLTGVYWHAGFLMVLIGVVIFALSVAFERIIKKTPQENE